MSKLAKRGDTVDGAVDGPEDGQSQGEPPLDSQRSPPEQFTRLGSSGWSCRVKTNPYIAFASYRGCVVPLTSGHITHHEKLRPTSRVLGCGCIFQKQDFTKPDPVTMPFRNSGGAWILDLIHSLSEASNIDGLMQHARTSNWQR